mmetsp:Transcript_1307/g.2891  ORF Transcript_1307/g.2891 Transcript_1307/m.2891 type:complete len:640 (+) Transcript_1307:85-2004(+)|eukprot:CAMPEP_0206436582 /NCGR_PEP_ID=MMETSP0324_2-20121206/10562_1 /ASSEMBLY_ACC=CAM_ASM_000836 /TAXON_ID=2866 /ORGANISM="Crypthecodinium cohnii, Strain Seligo" /LENGTH=639 /DNA_ID=CAMNT_0053903761 /DNA_START=64 /DNA_END=1983 /DNA_ORIENTATION=-
MARKELESQLKQLNESVARSPADANLFRKRGDVRRRLGQYKEAVQDFETALALNSELSAAWHGRGQTYRLMGKLKEATEDFSAAIKLDPLNAILRVDRASLRQQQGELDLALEDAQEALGLNPKFVAALHLRGEVLRKRKVYSEALKDFDAALQLEPQHVACLAGRGAVHRALGCRAQALRDYEAAVRLSPQRETYLVGRGATRLELRMSEEAADDFEHALKLNPKSSYALWGREAAREQQSHQGLQITLGGFTSAHLNTTYLERRRPGYQVNGFATFWSPDSKLFLFYSQADERWKGARWVDFAKIRSGASLALIAAPQKTDIRLASKLAKGWNEFDGKTWVRKGSMGVESVSKLQVNIQTVNLSGFKNTALNNRYGERFRPKYLVNGESTYWSAKGELFLYWCSKEDRWKGTDAKYFEKVKGGATFGFIGAPIGADITWPDNVKGWHEWDGARWVRQTAAGVDSVSTLAKVKTETHDSKGSSANGLSSKEKLAVAVAAKAASSMGRGGATAAATVNGAPKKSISEQMKRKPLSPAAKAELKAHPELKLAAKIEAVNRLRKLMTPPDAEPAAKAQRVLPPEVYQKIPSFQDADNAAKANAGAHLSAINHHTNGASGTGSSSSSSKSGPSNGNNDDDWT